MLLKSFLGWNSSMPLNALRESTFSRTVLNIEEARNAVRGSVSANKESQFFCKKNFLLLFKNLNKHFICVVCIRNKELRKLNVARGMQ